MSKYCLALKCENYNRPLAQIDYKIAFRFGAIALIAGICTFVLVTVLLFTQPLSFHFTIFMSFLLIILLCGSVCVSTTCAGAYYLIVARYLQPPPEEEAKTAWV
jgi:hypothetical protein